MKIIITTTINKPTEAILKFCSMSDWHMIVVGDKKTPHQEYFNLEKSFSDFKYLHPDEQEQKYPELSNVLGWNCYERKNIGFIEAYKKGYEIIANVDDDNIPYDFWGKNLMVGKNVIVDEYDCDYKVFDPLMITNRPDKVKSRNSKFIGKKEVKCLVQADFWDGEPDVDAICKLTKDYHVKFDKFEPFTSSKIIPFNSQNTFIHRDFLPHYMMLLDTERMADIWGAYIAQIKHDLKEPYVVVHPSTVYHDRPNNPSPATNGTHRSMMDDFRVELQGYSAASNFLEGDNWKKYLTEKSLKALEIYENMYE